MENKIGVVVIGRNEGERLVRCLCSVIGQDTAVVYVDSGSTDDSVAWARSRGVEVVELDMNVPFTAARARNEGYARLRRLAPAADFVQFVDGDCELVAGWLRTAADFLVANPDVAVVSGRLRERHPERSVYNRLCDIEWEAPAGEARFCGGLAMIRTQAFEAAGGYRSDLIAGEEPELCVRLRALDWRIWRLVDDMGHHDAAMLRFGQWWRRSTRGGHAYAQGAHMHGAPPERLGVRESRRAWFWAAGLPAVIILAGLVAGPWALVLLLAYPVQIARLALQGTRSATDNWSRAFFLVLGKFPELVGQVLFHWRRLQGGRHSLIEHK